MPHVDNRITEDLSDQQLNNLATHLAKDHDQLAANATRLAMATGMRRGEILRLRWQDVDFTRGCITIVNPKSKHSRTMPVSEHVLELLQSFPPNSTTSMDLVFYGLSYGPDHNPSKRLRAHQRRLKEVLPPNFRPWHGLRHAFASRMASSGEVDLFMIGALLGHRTPAMTARYAHLRDDALRKAAEVGGRGLS